MDVKKFARMSDARLSKLAAGLTASEEGADHAYQRLLIRAIERDEAGLLAIAKEFYPEIVGACIGMALADFDHAKAKRRATWMYQYLIDALDKLPAPGAEKEPS